MLKIACLILSLSITLLPISGYAADQLENKNSPVEAVEGSSQITPNAAAAANTTHPLPTSQQINSSLDDTKPPLNPSQQSAVDPALQALINTIDCDEITSILPEVDEHTLVIFDVDYTLFRSKTLLGTPEWLMYLVYSEMAKGKTRAEGFAKWYPAWLKSQQFNEIALMDKKIPKLLGFLRKKNAHFIALTHRKPIGAEITHQQLEKLGLDLEKGLNLPKFFRFTSALDAPAIFHKGILYAQDVNEKGVVFIEWYSQIKAFLKHKPIKKVIFIDDSGKNVASLAFAVKALDLQYIGIRYSVSDNYKVPFNAKLVEQQAKILMANHPEYKTRLLLEEVDHRLTKS